MANVIRTVKLPDGNLQDIRVPEEWGATEIREALIKKGVISGEANQTRQEAPAASEPADLPPFEDPIRRTENAPDVPSLGERFIRSQKLGVRNVLEGAAGFPALVGDAANSLLNLIPGVELQMPSQMLNEALTDAGLPEPETPAERIAATTTKAVAGAIGGIGTAKAIATPFSAMLTEAAGTQVAAATAGGAAMGAAAEKDIGPLGQMGLGVTAAILGGAGFGAVSNSFARRLDQRLVLKDSALAEKEVQEMLAAEGVKVPDTAPELRALTEQLDELRVQGKVQEKLRQLAPKKEDTVEQARYKARERAKMGMETQPSIETVRMQQRLRERQVAEVEAKIRQIEEQKVKAKPAAKKAAEVATNAADQTDAAIARAMAVKPDPAVPRVTTGQNIGRLKARDSFGNAVIDRIQKLSPQMAIAVRRVTQRSTTRANTDINRIMKFYDSPQYHRLPKTAKVELDRMLLNGDDTGARSIMQRVDGLNELYHQNVRKPLMDMQKHRADRGADGFIEFFHPRVVKNVAGLRKAAKRNGTVGQLDQAIADAQRASHKARGHGLDEREVAALINQYVGGRPLKVLKDRRINEIGRDTQKYYESSRNSMIDYIRKFHSDDATREFFKNSLGKEIDFGKNAVNEVTVGELLAQSLKQSGGMDVNSLGEMAELLAVHFGVSRQGPGAFQRTFKNLFTAGTLGNPMSTLTQFGDIAPVMSKFGVLNTLRAANPLRNKAADVGVYEIGVRELSKDLRDVHGSAKVVRRALEYVGFDKLDTIMASNGIRAGMIKWRGAATKNPAATAKQLEKFFGKADAEQMVKDLQAGKMTDDIKTWMLHEIGNIRPISREDMPLQWNQHPNGRWMYSLLSWTLKQMNYARNKAQADWRAGKKLTAVKGLLGLSLLMGLTNGSVNTVKDFMLGRDIDPAENLVTGMLSLGMSGKYAVDALSRNQGLQALGSIIPALGITADAIQKTFTGTLNGDVMKLLEATPAGRNIVNLMAGPMLDMGAGAVQAIGQALTPTQPVTQPGPVQSQAPYTNNVQAPKVDVRPPEKPVEKPKASPMAQAKELLMSREGVEEQVYQTEIPDGEGGTKLDKPTAGIGHVLTEEELKKYPVGSTVPKDVIDKWFRMDSAKAFAAAQKQAKAVGRQDLIPVLTSVNFQLGTDWTSKFKKTWKLMQAGLWEEAANEAANSKWMRQTPTRVRDLQEALRRG